MKLIPYFEYDELFEARGMTVYLDGVAIDRIAGMKREKGKLYVKFMRHKLNEWITVRELFKYTDKIGNHFGQPKR